MKTSRILHAMSTAIKMFFTKFKLKPNVKHKPKRVPNCRVFNLLAPELFFFNFSTPVYKMLIIQEPNSLEIWNKLHFEEEKTEIM